jgi:hypothetical protein
LDTLAVGIETAREALRTLAAKIQQLATGLQGAAPTPAGGASASVQYLFEMAEALLQMTATGATDTSTSQQYEDLLVTLRAIVAKEAALREQRQLGERFRFVREQLQVILEATVALAPVAVVSQAVAEAIEGLADKRLVYVYLFNAQGLDLRSWHRMLTAQALYEHSINRPAYAEKTHIEALLRKKANLHQHAYLTVAVAPTEIQVLVAETTDIADDALTHGTARLKEGSLRTGQLVAFTHNGVEYSVTAAGELVKK